MISKGHGLSRCRILRESESISLQVGESRSPAAVGTLIGRPHLQWGTVPFLTPSTSTLHTLGYLKRQRYFRCPLPTIWLEDKCYNLCISWHVSTQLQESTEPSAGCCNSACPPPKDHTGVYLHPCGIYAHRGNPQKMQTPMPQCSRG